MMVLNDKFRITNQKLLDLQSTQVVDSTNAAQVNLAESVPEKVQTANQNVQEQVPQEAGPKTISPEAPPASAARTIINQ